MDTLPKTDEFRIWQDSGTNNVYVKHDPCGVSSDSTVSTLYDALMFRQTHICP